jgi:hypothetical protein
VEDLDGDEVEDLDGDEVEDLDGDDDENEDEDEDNYVPIPGVDPVYVPPVPTLPPLVNVPPPPPTGNLRVTTGNVIGSRPTILLQAIRDTVTDASPIVTYATLRGNFPVIAGWGSDLKDVARDLELSGHARRAGVGACRLIN